MSHAILDDLDAVISILEGNKDRVYSSGAVSGAILGVIDAGWKTKTGDKACYLFWDDESDEQTEMRMRFVDAVLARLKTL